MKISNDIKQLETVVIGTDAIKGAIDNLLSTLLNHLHTCTYGGWRSCNI